MPVIWVRTKAEYFCAEGLTRFLIIRSDLPVVLIVADPARNLRLRGKQISLRSAGLWGGQSASVPTNSRRAHDGGHAIALPTLRDSPSDGVTRFALSTFRGLAVRGNVGAVSRVAPDLVPHRAQRKPEHARGVGAVAVAARERLQHELALDLLNRGADQHRHDFVG